MDDEMQPLIYRPNRRRAQLAAIFLGASGLLCLMIIAALLMQVALLKRLEAGAEVTLAEALTNDNRLAILNTLDILLYLVTGIFFMMWLYRAYQNHVELAAGPVRYSPGWAVGGFITPILNFFRPYQVVADVWETALRPDPTETTTVSQPSKIIVLTWWLTFIVPALIARLANIVATTTTSDYLTPTVMLIAANGLLVVSAGLAIRIIQTIEQAHEENVLRECPFDNWPPVRSWNPAIYLGSFMLAAAIGWLVITRSVPADAATGTVAGVTDQAITSTPTAAFTSGAGSGAAGSSRPAAPTKRVSAALKPSEFEARGKEYLNAGDYDRALSEFSQALQDDPDNARLHYLRGITHTWLGDYDKALVDFNQAIQLDPEYVEAYYERGMAHLNLGNQGLAGKDFDQALKLDAKYADAYIGRSWLHYLLDEYADALKDADRAIDLDKRAVDAYHVRGLIYLNTGEFDQAIADFSEAIRLEPESALAFNRRGMAYHSTGDLEKALQDYEQALSLAPDFIDVYYNRGSVNYDRGAYPAALSDFTTVIEHYPQFGAAYLKRGTTYGQIKEYDKAIADIEQALKLELSAADRAGAKQLLEDFKAARAGKSS